MCVFDVIKARRSIRKYKKAEVPRQYIERILEAARLAPSAGNRQPWSFIVVTDPEKKKLIAEACAGQTWMADAGAIIVACGHPEVSERWYAIDTAIAMEHLILAAHELGLGTCWIGAFNESRIKQLLGIPSNVRVVALTPVGYPDESPPPRPRKTLDEVVHWEKW